MKHTHPLYGLILMLALLPTLSFSFGGGVITLECFCYILDILPRGKTILEIGSGFSSEQFSRHYTVYSLEHNERWMNKFNTNYIYAPIVNKWYDREILKQKLPQEYDLIIIDGPSSDIGREGFFTNLDLFRTDVPIIFDDMHVSPYYETYKKVAEALGREIHVFGKRGIQVPEPFKPADKTPKFFGVVFPPGWKMEGK